MHVQMITFLLRYGYHTVFISVTSLFYRDVNYSKFSIIYSCTSYLLKKAIIFYLEIALVLSSIQNTDVAPDCLRSYNFGT